MFILYSYDVCSNFNLSDCIWHGWDGFHTGKTATAKIYCSLLRNKDKCTFEAEHEIPLFDMNLRIATKPEAKKKDIESMYGLPELSQQ